jgi:hypothetical protein
MAKHLGYYFCFIFYLCDLIIFCLDNIYKLYNTVKLPLDYLVNHPITKSTPEKTNQFSKLFCEFCLNLKLFNSNALLHNHNVKEHEYFTLQNQFRNILSTSIH